MTEFERQAWRRGDAVPAWVTWGLREPEEYIVTVNVDGREWTATARDVFSALVEVRNQLDAQGILLGVEGSRLQSYPSGMMRDMGAGLSVLRLEMGRPSRREDFRDIFAEAPLDELATVADQKQFFDGWLNSLGRATLARVVEPAGYEISGGIGT
ncbi:hypothetical protein EYE40_15205 [Glaciihabitans arcticus]|uniref:Uncharacterized protein n=1 Tax=Glaciihabitans arcticus TaxID=2668039 RepID=A0A4Q9GRY3_9MICO|nr:hypothetical protein [Glaciihabitans arcticus]TBN55544.1 hypothetical protein EYE40_15205 [Glaciihabitans arcticus]